MIDSVDVAHHMALAPIGWLTVQHARGRPVALHLWWLAVAFAMSWVVDSVDSQLPIAYRWAPSTIYPPFQAAVVGAVFLLRRVEAMQLVIVLTAVAIVSVLSFDGATGPDVLAHTTAWLAIIGIVWARPELGRIRSALIIGFGLMTVTWVRHVAVLSLAALSVPTWYAYEVARAIGLALFCWASMATAPALRLSRRDA